MLRNVECRVQECIAEIRKSVFHSALVPLHSSGEWNQVDFKLCAAFSLPMNTLCLLRKRNQKRSLICPPDHGLYGILSKGKADQVIK